MRIVRKALAPDLLAPALLAATLAWSGGASATEPLDGRGLAPYRFNPPPDELSPSQEGVAEAYRSRLRSGLSPLERQRLHDTPRGREVLRDRRGELNRMERLLDNQ